ncbi:MAG: ABC transporter substrate binding protein [Desulfovibrionaceae bacterium]|nr:ABC transporter substrate binding protein [Desulfovibrionaceae bacterium]
MRCFSLFLLLFLSCLMFFPQMSYSREYSIAVMCEGTLFNNVFFIRNFPKMLNNPKIRSDSNISITGKVFLYDSNIFLLPNKTDQDLQVIEEKAAQLMQRRDIDLIVALDLASGSALIRQNNGRTPVLIACMEDPVREGLVARCREQNIRNISFSISANHIKRNIAILKRFASVKRPGIIVSDSSLGKRYSHLQEIREAFAGDRSVSDSPADLVTVHLEADTHDACARAVEQLAHSGIDSFFITGQQCFNVSRTATRSILEPLFLNGIPTFGFRDNHAFDGALLTLSTDIQRKICFDGVKVLRMLEGVEPASLPEKSPYRPRITLNLKSAGRLGFMPSYDLLATCDRILYDHEENDK